VHYSTDFKHREFTPQHDGPIPGQSLYYSDHVMLPKNNEREISMETNNAFTSLATAFVTAAAIGLAGCYTPAGNTPEPLKPKETKLWSDAQVDEIAEISYVKIDASERIAAAGAPEECNTIGFLRIRSKNGPVRAEQADAALLMVPGVLEGAAAFEYIGRQMVYLAEKEHGKHIEVWGLDRRSNCLEDLTGIELAKKSRTVEQGIDVIANYYYFDQPIDGKKFQGFKSSAELPFLAEFGMRQTAIDMYDVIHYMMPTAGVSKQKVFVGGHSLGGIHTSVFLSWDFDGNPQTLDDAGYNLVAGAFGFETVVRPLNESATLDKNLIPSAISKRLNISSLDSRAMFNPILDALEAGVIPRMVDFPGLFTPEVIALPEFLAIAAALAPDAESTLMRAVPLSPSVLGITGLLHSSTPPLLADFRYTNKALLGIFFDDHFQPLGFLQAGLGFLNGGPVKVKNEIAAMTYFIAGDAGPDLSHLHEGPLYGWAARDQIGDLSDTDFLDVTGSFKFTDLENEPVDMDDFIRALSTTPTNLTEWYFPTRILLDAAVVGKRFAPSYGLNTYHPDGVTHVDSLVMNGSQGLNPFGRDLPPVPRQTLIKAPGYTHLDPMFEAINSPSQTSYVMRPLLDFVLDRI